MHYLLYLKDKKEERGTDYDRPKLYHPRDNQCEEQINGSAAEYYRICNVRYIRIEIIHRKHGLVGY
jgi:hypothetical protein